MTENKFCNDCKKETKVVTIDAGIYPGHTVLEDASSCCHTDFDDGVFVMCKCGNEIEIHPDMELHEVICAICKRTGCVTLDY